MTIRIQRGVRAASFAAVFVSIAAAANAHDRVLSPNGGETFQAGDTVTIEWTVIIEHTLLSWDVFFSPSGDQGPWIPIAMGLPPGDPTVNSAHSFDWTVPDIATNEGSILVRMIAMQANYDDTSDQNFTIEGSLGVRGCAGQAANSTGLPSTLTLTGSDVAADNQLLLTVTDLPASVFGFAVNSDTSGLLPMPGGSQGTLCLGGVIGRHVDQITLASQTGTVSIPIDLTVLPRGSTLESATAGQTWHFQWWHRDVNPVQTSNFSDSVALTLQ